MSNRELAEAETGAKASGDALGPNTSLQTSEVHRISQSPCLAPGHTHTHTKKKLHRSPQRPGNHVTRRQTPKVPLSNTSNFYFLLFLSDRLAHAPAASPPALSSFQHFGLWEASGYLLSSSTGLGGPKAQPLPGGRSRCSRGRGTERPPLLPRPGVGRLGLSCWARGARRGDLPAWSGSRRSRVAVAAGPPPHVPTADPPPTRPGCGGPGPHFSQPGKEVCERRGGRWGWGGVIGETRRKDVVLLLFCLFVCFSGSLAETLDHMLGGY